MLTRRDFLKGMAALAGGAVLAGVPGQSLAHEDRPIPVPPALMLHSRDAGSAFLPPLLEGLQRHGFTALTWQQWHERRRQKLLPARPVILSIDDISMARGGSPAFDTFVRMQETIARAGMTAVFGVITEPVWNGQIFREQDRERWALMREWVLAGFELATHTSHHSNFNRRDSGPRDDFGPADYEGEIGRSAALISAQLAEQGISYQTDTLITPYGSGYSYKLPHPAIHPGIETACRQAGIRQVVGIVGGRTPIPPHELADPRHLLYLGRAAPVYHPDTSGRSRPQVAETLQRVLAWDAANRAITAHPHPDMR
jgi:peptidoglycan/xylan/chitin deacetylase (PgdA/CDA1 family)